MSNARRNLLVAAAVVAIAYLALVLLWATQPLSDAVPVGVDWTPTTEVPPKPQRVVSQDVPCNNLFARSAHGSKPLPVLTPQPEGRDPLFYNRAPCKLVQSDARKIFGLNTVLALALFVGLLVLGLRQRPRPIDEDVGFSLPS